MLTVTECAKQELKKALPDDATKPDLGLRLVVTGPGELSLVPDRERESDQVVEHEGSKVLIVDKELSDVLEGTTIDCEETNEGQRLVLVQREKSSQQE